MLGGLYAKNNLVLKITAPPTTLLNPTRFADIEKELTPENFGFKLVNPHVRLVIGKNPNGEVVTVIGVKHYSEDPGEAENPIHVKLLSGVASGHSFRDPVVAVHSYYPIFKLVNTNLGKIKIAQRTFSVSHKMLIEPDVFFMKGLSL